MTSAFTLILLLLPTLVSVATDLPPDAVLVEAENYSTFEGSEATGLKPHDMTWASGRTALIRFPTADRVGWTLKSIATGEQELWIRYAATTEARLRWAIDEGESTELRGPGLGSGKHRDEWSWVKLGGASFAANQEFTLWIERAPIRPDCILLLPLGSGEPDWPPVVESKRLNEELASKLEEIEPRSSPFWLKESAALIPPVWIARERVALHTRLSVAWTDDPLFAKAAKASALLGAPAITRFVKSRNGETFWPSKWGQAASWVEAAMIDPVNPVKAIVERLDPVQAIADRAHSAGLAFVAYHTFSEDRPLAKANPDWICRDAWGREIRFGREFALCLRSPYGQVALGRLRELAARGADGIYLDESHQPLEGCWCSWSRDAFLRETGLPLPSAPLLEDPLYQRFLSFTEDSIAREFWRWRTELKADYPDFAFLVSSHNQPALLNPLPTMRLATVADVVKTEFRTGVHPDLLNFSKERDDGFRPSLAHLMRLGWAISRDGAFGRPAHVWIHKLEGAERWKASAAAVIASGCVANLDHPEETLPDKASFAEAFERAKQMGDLIGGTRPISEVLLHFPERARNKLLSDRELAWTEVIEPFVMAWERLSNEHLPVRIIGDDELAFGIPKTTQLLLLPNEKLLEEDQRAALALFRERRGRVLDAGSDDLVAAARACELRATLDAPEGVQASWFRGGTDWVIGISNSVEWLLDSSSKAPEAVTGAILKLHESIQGLFMVVDGGEVEWLECGEQAEVRLPNFQDSLVVRIKR